MLKFLYSGPYNENNIQSIARTLVRPWMYYIGALWFCRDEILVQQNDSMRWLEVSYGKL